MARWLLLPAEQWYLAAFDASTRWRVLLQTLDSGLMQMHNFIPVVGSWSDLVTAGTIEPD